MAHVLVVPSPGQGHMNPMVQFAKTLASRGVLTTFVTTRFIARTAGVDAWPATVATISDGHDDGGFASATSITEYLEKQRATASASLAELIEARASSPAPFTCIVHDSLEQCVPPLASRLGVPAVPFATQSCAVSAVYHYVSQGRLAVPPAAADNGGVVKSEALDGLPEMERTEFPSFVFGDGPYPMLTEMALNQFAHVGKDDLVLFNSFEELESEVLDGLSNHMKARCIGPCVPLPAELADIGSAGHITYGANLLNPDKACIKWLDTKARGSVAYISFGSSGSLSLGAAQMEELGYGLLAAGKPFLWVVRPTEATNLPRGLLDEATASGAALIVRWSPQLEVLAHPAVGCFLTHCGWNSTLEALSFGVPMVALGLWTDQPMNAMNVERAWAAGVRARRDVDAGMFLRGEVERCVRAVIEEGEEADALREAAGKWRNKARAAVAPGGSSDRNLDEFLEFVRASPRKEAMAIESKETAGPEI